MSSSGFPAVRTEDGTVIVRCPKTSIAASGPTLADALVELRRLLSQSSRRKRRRVS